MLRKSPELNKLNLNKVSIQKNDEETMLNITNEVENIENYGSVAEKQGYKKITNAIMRELKKLTERDVEL